MFEALSLARGDGRHERILKTIARMDVLIIDDWGLAVLTAPERRDLLEILEDRHGRASTIVTSQLPVEHWHEAIGVQWTLRPPMRDVHGKGFLATAEHAEDWHIPVQADQAKQAVDEASRLPQRHAEQDLHRQAGLDGSTAVDGLSPPACRRALPPTTCQDRTNGA
jgi:hypothetical protein